MYFDDATRLIASALDAGVSGFDVGVYDGDTPRGRSISHTDIIFGRALDLSGVDKSRVQLQLKLWLINYPEVGLREQLENAARRINVERFDSASIGMYLPGINFERVLEDIAELIADGLLGSWGSTGWPAEIQTMVDEMAKERGLPRPQLAQLKYNVSRRSVADGPDYARVFAETETRLQASHILEGGWLTGRTPERRVGEDKGSILSRIQGTVPELKRIAAEFGVTPAVLATSFVFTHPSTADVLVGVSNTEQLADVMAARELAATQGADIRAAVSELQQDADVVLPGDPS